MKLNRLILRDCKDRVQLHNGLPAKRAGRHRPASVRPASRLSMFLLVMFLVGLLLAAGCGSKQPAGNQAAAGALAVSTQKAEPGTLDNVLIFSGKLEALQSADVVSKVPGKVAQVHVDVGDRVSAGQVLVTLENKDLADRVAQAEAGVKQASAALSQAEAGLKSAQANLSNARANYAVAEANYKRAQELLATGAIPQATFETQYELPYKQAKEAAEGTAPAQVELARAQIEQARAALSSAQVQLALARQAYEDSFIRAPFSGEVTARHVEPGEVASTAAPVISMVNLDKVVVKATVGENYINQLKQNQEVQVKVQAAGEHPFKGVVTNIAPAADPVTKSFPIKVQVDNPNHVLKPGMFAEVQLSRTQQKFLLVPRQAVVSEQGKEFVWVVTNGTVSKREVKTGDSDSRNIAITAGLKEGEEVVTAGMENLKDGAKVTVRNG
ncbi:cobalt-zinc-cadmium efflux system membrane fusion protein [Desulfofundulus luciae]|uniref:Cobalt-zinc-cadmium efflux system membrane fusion protein n=1 Tax=Desulfofundulus luciae TaxID=74702 RepID=A0ABU0AX57_9FIRM|nr:efflux RND transporter periplasmic adaptor subunit [Desulfofundulus luciae]MDQ0285074.1 cobalt-zinc-cadmium efflux system membrane fusion protein [Desulfofundulus luciae]